MLLQHPHQAGVDPERATFQERLEGFSTSIPKEVQPESDAVHLDQGTGTLPAHHRSDQRIPSVPPKEAQATEVFSQYYKGLTGRCTSLRQSKRETLLRRGGPSGR